MPASYSAPHIARGVVSGTGWRTRIWGGAPRIVPVTNPIIRDRLEREHARHEAEQNRATSSDSRCPGRGTESNDDPAGGPRCRGNAAPPEGASVNGSTSDRLERGELPLSISSTNRLFNGLSGLTSDFRQFVRLDGNRIGCIDISNSQPALLGNLLEHGFPHEWGKRMPNMKDTPARRPSPRSLPSLLPSLPLPSPALLRLSPPWLLPEFSTMNWLSPSMETVRSSRRGSWSTSWRSAGVTRAPWRMCFGRCSRKSGKPYGKSTRRRIAT